MPRKIFFLLVGLSFCLLNAFAEERPNVVWIFGEDMGPELGCYGDAQAITPNMDRLAREGARYDLCFTHAPVCSPSRSGLITGIYPITAGTMHHRSQVLKKLPMFTDYLREAGYTVAWPTKSDLGKTDFNFLYNPKESFDILQNWTKNMPKQPFFGFANILYSHESKIRVDAETFNRITAKLKPSERHDPAKMKLPSYYPDAPEVRRDLANYYDLVTAVDYRVGEILAELDRQGVTSNTVVILSGDHGRGLPRAKRWIYDSGLRVPLIVRWPGHIAPGTVMSNLVSFIDFAPTTLALAGVGKPSQMQGVVFLGPKTELRKYVYGARDRMDETTDRIRCVRDKQFKYIRNFSPELPYAQRIAYNEEMPTMKVWRQWNKEGKLTGPQKLFFAPTKPKEELYDCAADPDEVNNLAGKSEYAAKQKELSAALDKWIADCHDMGAIPETELIKRGVVADRLKEYDKRKE